MRKIKFKSYTPSGMVDVLSIDFATGFAKFEDVLGIQFFSIEEFPLLQYTGLKDKNGVEIYKGDIVKGYESDIVCEVIYTEGAMFMLRWCDTKWGDNEYHHYGLGAFTLEVIGNIYEKAELEEK